MRGAKRFKVCTDFCEISFTKSRCRSDIIMRLTLRGLPVIISPLCFCLGGGGGCHFSGLLPLWEFHHSQPLRNSSCCLHLYHFTSVFLPCCHFSGVFPLWEFHHCMPIRISSCTVSFFIISPLCFCLGVSLQRSVPAVRISLLSAFKNFVILTHWIKEKFCRKINICLHSHWNCSK